jgi:hypothetical protein
MIKTSFGAPIGYGPTLPPAESTADGVLFFKTATDAGGPPGLYLYGFQFDSTLGTLGDQVGQGWRIASDLANYILKAGDTVTGTLLFTNANPTIQATSPGIRFTETDQAAGSKEWLVVVDGNTFQVQARDDAFSTAMYPLTVTRAGVGRLNGNVIWNSGNMGTGSTLDADYLDGQHGTYYSNLANSTGSLDLNSRTSGTLTVSRGGTNITSVTVGGLAYGASATQYGFTAAGLPGQILQSNGTAAPSWISASGLAASSANKLATARSITLSGNASGTVLFDGSADVTIVTTVSNSATLAGYLPNSSAAGSTIALRDGSGYLYAGYFNQGSGNNENPAISQIMVTNGSDNFLRKASVATLASALSAAGLPGYVAKSGDSMSGSLTVGAYIQVNGITLNSIGSTIVTSGSITAALFTGPGTGLTGTASSLTAGNSSALGGTAASGYALLTGANFTGAVAATQFNGSGTGLTGTASSLTAGNSSALGGTAASGYALLTGALFTGTVIATQFNGSGAGLTGTASSLTVGNSSALGGTAASGYALLTGATFSGDLHTYRSGAPSTGVIYLDQTNSHYLYFDSANYNLPSGGLILGGTLTASGDVIAYSDRRVKKNIVTIENALEKVIALRGVEFDRIEDDAHSVGLIAQEVQEVIPSVVRESPDGTLGVAYGNLVGVLVEAIKEQQKQIEVLTARLNKLVD